MDYGQPINKEEDWKCALEGIQCLSPIAGESGIQLNMESLNRFENYLINTAAECVRFVREIGYDKRVVMEPFVNMGGQVGQDIKVWRPLCGDVTEAGLDQDARNAVVFQRYMLD